MSMNGSGISDILALANAINTKREEDKSFVDLLGEISSALADIVSMMEAQKEAQKEAPEKEGDANEYEALAEVIGKAIVDGLSALKPPSISVPAAQPVKWVDKRVEFEWRGNNLMACTVTRA